MARKEKKRREGKPEMARYRFKNIGVLNLWIQKSFSVKIILGVHCKCGESQTLKS